ncbi:MAG: hypothetical protein AAFY13_12490, partial [Pseudomonadota bacterium]
MGILGPRRRTYKNRGTKTDKRNTEIAAQNHGDFYPLAQLPETVIEISSAKADYTSNSAPTKAAFDYIQANAA